MSQTSKSRFVVQITLTDHSYRMLEETIHEDRAVVQRWADQYVELMDDVVSAKVVRYYTPEQQAEIRARYLKAVEEFGMKETITLVDKLINPGDIPLKATASKFANHPGFELLHDSRKADIRVSHDYGQMKFFAAQLLSAVATHLGLDPIGAKTPETVWRTVITDCKAILYAPPELQMAQKTRAEREARTAANRAERAAAAPAKGPGKGGGKTSRATK